jgi:V-type H+-transporting ATPase subunit D
VPLQQADDNQVQNKKQRDVAAQDAEMAARKAAKEKAAAGSSDKENTTETTDLLGEGEDEDVIF